MAKQNLRVWYCFQKLTKKAIKKLCMAVVFENESYNPQKNEEWVNRRFHVAYVRKQTADEASDAPYKNRTFTTYSYFFKDKRFKGSLERILENNFNADANHVSVKERNEINNKLKLLFFKIKYNNHEDYVSQEKQLALKFDL